MKILIFLFTFLLVSSIFSQDSTETERIYKQYNGLYMEVSENPTTYTYLDSVTQLPINGWMIFSSKKNIWVQHYTEGIPHGYSVKYELKNRKYHLTTASYYNGNNSGEIPKQVLYFDYKKQYTDSNSWNYGLLGVEIDDPEITTGNYYLSRRKIDFRKKVVKVKDRYYFHQAKKFTNVNYKVATSVGLWNPYYFDSLRSIFPIILNETKSPFSFLQFNGYYRQSTEYTDEHYSFTQFAKFYPDGTVKYVWLSGNVEKVENWDSIPSIHYECSGNTVEFNAVKTNTHFKTIAVFPTGIILQITRGTGWLDQSQYMFDYIKIQ